MTTSSFSGKDNYVLGSLENDRTNERNLNLILTFMKATLAPLGKSL